MALGAFAGKAGFIGAVAGRLATLAPARRALPTVAGVKRAAVLCPLVARHGEVHVLFTLRSGQVGTHKNQVSFPGGHMDAGESAAQAAVRECVEELGAAGSAVALGAYHDAIASTFGVEGHACV